jgi:hypothetical protein
MNAMPCRLKETSSFGKSTQRKFLGPVVGGEVEEAADTAAEVVYIGQISSRNASGDAKKKANDLQ